MCVWLYSLHTIAVWAPEFASEPLSTRDSPPSGDQVVVVGRVIESSPCPPHTLPTTLGNQAGLGSPSDPSTGEN